MQSPQGNHRLLALPNKSRTTSPMIMRPGQPRWQEFMWRLKGPEGLNARLGPGGALQWDCHDDLRGSAAVLARMGLTLREIEASCRYFARQGGYCDCEVLLNVGET